METKLLIVKVIQLPIILLLVIFSFRASYAYRVSKGNLIRNNFIEDLPFLFLEIGFLFNLIAIISGILIKDENSTFVIVVGSLTSSFFLISVLYHFIPNIKSVISKILVVILAILFLLAINMLFKAKEPNWSIHIVDFIVFALTSIFLYQKVSIRDIVISNFFTNNYVLVGFLMWTFLQLWKPIGPYLFEQYGLKAEDATCWTNLVGYSVSAIGKGLILFGLYNFSIKKVEYAISNERKKNNQLSILQELINSISNSTNLQNLANGIVEHLTNKQVFNFEYAIFSEVNYPKYKIQYKDSITTNSKIRLVDEWVLKDGIPLNHQDIMALVVRKRNAIHVYGEMLDGKKIDINDSNSPLNKKIYQEYEHKNLNRFFIPILNLKKTKESPNRVVAIIEVGHYVPKERIYMPNRIFHEAELNIYLDNCAQVYERIANQEIQEEIESLIKICDEQSRDEPLKYLQTVLTATCDFLKLQYGLIILLPFGNISRNHNLVFGESILGNKDKANIEKILNNCIEQSFESENEFKINEDKFKFEAIKSLKSNSIQISRIEVHNLTIGYLFLLSQHKHFFNEVVEKIVNNVSANIGSNYKEKKFHKSVASLVTSGNAITDLEVNMKPLIDMIKSYFDTPYISIWIKNEVESFCQKFSSSEFRESCKRYGEKKILSRAINLDEEYKIIPLTSSPVPDDYEAFKEFAVKNGISTLLQKPIKTQHQQFGFINIYFKSVFNKLTYEDINFFNLVSIKALTTIQIHNLVGAFRKISDSFTRSNLNETLQIITDSAVELLNADPVILFKSNNGEDVYFKDVTYSILEDFRNSEILNIFKSNEKSNSHVELAELIIKDKTHFFENQTEYEKYLGNYSKKHEQVHFQKDFWNREEIKSMAAIRLVNNIKNKSSPVGVMFINFRSQIVFRDETKKLIETFAAFAAGSIYNGNIFQRNRQYLLHNLRMTKPLIAEVLAASTLHNAHKTYKAVNSMYYSLMRDIKNPGYGNKSMSAIDITVQLEDMEPSIKDLFIQFNELSTIYKPNENLQIRRCSLSNIIKNQLDKLEVDFNEKLIHIQDNFSQKDIQIECDEGLIGDVLFNIIINAYQAMSKRGNLEIRLIETSDNKAKIEIVDDGKGINDDLKEIITEPYVTDKADGSGLGLAMSKLTIEQHRGHLSYQSKNKRTTFTIILPNKFNDQIKSYE